MERLLDLRWKSLPAKTSSALWYRYYVPDRGRRRYAEYDELICHVPRF